MTVNNCFLLKIAMLLLFNIACKGHACVILWDNISIKQKLKLEINDVKVHVMLFALVLV